eukprot:2972325-Amphidinium_carterae.1
MSKDANYPQPARVLIKTRSLRLNPPSATHTAQNSIAQGHPPRQQTLRHQALSGQLRLLLLPIPPSFYQRTGGVTGVHVPLPQWEAHSPENGHRATLAATCNSTTKSISRVTTGAWPKWIFCFVAFAAGPRPALSRSWHLLHAGRSQLGCH